MTTTNAALTLYIAPATRITDRDLAGEDNSFKTGADAMRAAVSMNETNPLDGDDWVVCYQGPSTAGGVVADQEALDAFAVDMDAAMMLYINGFGDPAAEAEASRLLGHDLEPLAADRGEEPSGTTLRAEIAKCIAEARRQGWTGDTYELTAADCDSIVTNLCRKPTRAEWAAEGYGAVGGAHVADEADAEDAATAALELNEQLTHRGFETLTAAELRALADSDEGLDSMIDDLHKTSPLPSGETGAVLPAYRAEVRGVLRDWLREQAEERGGHGTDQVKTSLVLFARGDDAEIWRC